MASLHRMQHAPSVGGSDSSIPDLARRAKIAAPALGLAGTTIKDAALRAAANRLEADVGEILAANVDDLANGRADAGLLTIHFPFQQSTQGHPNLIRHSQKAIRI